jgi:hypothetical protein
VSRFLIFDPSCVEFRPATRLYLVLGDELIICPSQMSSLF